MIYFIAAIGTNFVKIGHGSDPVKDKNKFTVEIHRLTNKQVEELADAIGRAQ